VGKQSLQCPRSGGHAATIHFEVVASRNGGGRNERTREEGRGEADERRDGLTSCQRHYHRRPAPSLSRRTYTTGQRHVNTPS
jgi:hypothetical protein